MGIDADTRSRRPANYRRQLRRAMRPVWMLALGFSLVGNLLLLVSPIYMLQIYDRILTSGSVDSLIWLSAIAIFLLLIYAATESGRRRVMVAGGDRLESVLNGVVFRRFQNAPNAELAAQLNSVLRIKQMFSGQSLLPFFDLPFAPLFILLLFIIHPLLGFIGVGGAAFMLMLAVFAEFSTRKRTDAASLYSSQANALAAAIDRDQDTIMALGMAGTIQGRHDQLTSEARTISAAAAKAEGSYSGWIKSSRQSLQVIVLGVGAALALAQNISPGTVVAGSIILSRALAPIDQIVGGWRSLTKGRSAWRGLKAAISDLDIEHDSTPLPSPDATLQVERLEVAAPFSEDTLIFPVSLKVDAGSFYTLVGPIGSGKTTLLRTMCGINPALSGTVRLGGANLHTWQSQDRGQYIGYVPQRVSLLPGTLKENISRFQEVPDSEVYRALQMAGATELVMRLPQGLDTVVGLHQLPLSSGQAQLIGLARALLTKPKVLFLDEPTANLDPNTAQGFSVAIANYADSGRIVIASTHDLRLVRNSDSVLVLLNGEIRRETSSEFLDQQRAAQIHLATKQGSSAV